MTIQVVMAKKKSKQKKKPWYSEGLRFECTQCGACCSGEPGYVWVNDEEIAAMAEEMGLEVDAFEGKFVRKVGKECIHWKTVQHGSEFRHRCPDGGNLAHIRIAADETYRLIRVKIQINVQLACEQALDFELSA